MTTPRLALVLIVAVLAFIPACLTGQPEGISDEEVRRVHDAAILVDLHSDLPNEVIKGIDIGKRLDKGHTDIPRLREGGVDAVFFAAYIAPSYAAKEKSAHRLLEMIDTIRHDIVAAHPDDFVLALTADDIERAAADGKIAAVIGIEGGHGIEDSLRILRVSYDLGARYMTLTHNITHNWADSSADIGDSSVTHHGGLSEFGEEVVREMNDLGMMVDVSHVADETFWDVIEVSRAPIVATHSACRSITDIARNMTDEMIAAVAERGGVVHIPIGGCEFLNKASADASPYFNPARSGADWSTVPRATMENVIAHINHAVKIAGIDGVGIGSDYDGVVCTPIGLEDNSKFATLTRALLEEGYSAEDIRKIYGGNSLRVMRAVEQAATLR